MGNTSSDGPPRSRFHTAVLIFLAVLAVAAPARAFDLESRVKEFTLDNGLKVLVLERAGSPTFAAHISFKVGSVEESSGHTGAAHMLEHMLFKGTTSLGTLDWRKERPLLDKVNRLGDALDKARLRGENADALKKLEAELAAAQAEQKTYIESEVYSRLYQAEGGVGFNAGTSKDTTNYIIRLPVEKLRLWAEIESQRLKDAVFREYYSERDVVREERRSSYENQPSGKLYERFLAAAFIAHPYGWPIIGWESDLATLPLSEMERFYKTWYVPNNTVIAIVGAAPFDEVKNVVTRHFGAIPAKPLPDRVVTSEPAQGGERRVTVESDANPTFMMGFHKPTWPDRDDQVFEVIHNLLADGRSSRLKKSLVYERKVAVSVETWEAPGSRYPNLFVVSGDPRLPHTVADVERAVWDELEKLKREPVSERELTKVINNIEADLIRGMASDYGMARLLASYQQIAGDWREALRAIEKVKSVTAADIMRVATTYLTRGNMTMATLTQVKK